MKKSILLVTGLSLLLLTTGCQNKENEQKITEQSKTIESQSKIIESMKKENETLSSSAEKKNSIALEKGESITLSGQSMVGEEIPAGIYDIKPEDEKVYISVSSSEKDWYDDLMMSSNNSDDTSSYEKERKSYNLKDGYKLEITGSATFTKVR